MLLGILCGSATTYDELDVAQCQSDTRFRSRLLSIRHDDLSGVLIGTLMPMFFQKVGIDPAHASGPFITSILDVATMTIYLTYRSLFPIDTRQSLNWLIHT